jgi:hypothetical protein
MRVCESRDQGTPALARAPGRQVMLRADGGYLSLAADGGLRLADRCGDGGAPEPRARLEPFRGLSFRFQMPLYNLCMILVWKLTHKIHSARHLSGSTVRG